MRFEGDSGKNPLRREKQPEVDKSTITEPKALTTEQKEEIYSYVVFAQKQLGDRGKCISEGIVTVGGLGGFSFQSVTTRNHGRLPTTEISFWYHPGRDEPLKGHQINSVIDVIFEGEFYYGQEWTRGENFNLYPGWQNALRNLIRDPRKAELDFDTREESLSARTISQVVSAEEENERRVRGKAFRLSIVNSSHTKTA